MYIIVLLWIPALEPAPRRGKALGAGRDGVGQARRRRRRRHHELRALIPMPETLCSSSPAGPSWLAGLDCRLDIALPSEHTPGRFRPHRLPSFPPGRSNVQRTSRFSSRLHYSLLRPRTHARANAPASRSQGTRMRCIMSPPPDQHIPICSAPPEQGPGTSGVLGAFVDARLKHRRTVRVSLFGPHGASPL